MYFKNKHFIFHSPVTLVSKTGYNKYLKDRIYKEIFGLNGLGIGKVCYWCDFRIFEEDNR